MKAIVAALALPENPTIAAKAAAHKLFLMKNPFSQNWTSARPF
ncbi:hypothetical protein BF49_2523 [Bradyrhizobium sp.]|nr:hypothetical protein BF49_2523 [Bradyrhizobium sp.]